ncbi:hypothetical protein J6590_021187 [Homalodisca vitripennis]|nr:hypothetical protein J6590_021187 [Homalodisca vitripennis]
MDPVGVRHATTGFNNAQPIPRLNMHIKPQSDTPHNRTQCRLYSSEAASSKITSLYVSSVARYRVDRHTDEHIEIKILKPHD